MDSVQPKAVEERPILFQGVAQEVVRGPLTERVHVVLDTRCITLNRGPILALLRGGVRSVSLPLARIVDVEIASRKGQETVFDAGQAGSIKLYGSNGVLFASMLWVLGLPGGPPPRRRGFLATATGTLLRSTKANITVAILTGPAGLALVPKNFLDEASGGGENLRMAGRDILYAKMVKKTIVEVGTRDNVLQFACKSQQGGSQKAFEVLQRLRAIMITADPQRSDVDAAGRKPLDSFEEFPEYLASLDPPLEDPGELLIAGRVVWSPDEWNAYRSTVILGTGQLTLLPDTKSVPPTQMITARTRRGIAPEGETALPMLRIQMPARTHILRPLGGTGFVKLFWGAIAPHQFLLPGEDFDITPWRPVIGQVRFARVTPDAVVEQILRPALIAKREDGIGIVMCEGEPWDWDPGVFLYLEASRPRGVYRFAGQYLRLEPISELPFKDANHLGANPEDVLRAAIIMPGPLIPELQPAKRSLLRLPTDEVARGEDAVASRLSRPCFACIVVYLVLC